MTNFDCLDGDSIVLKYIAGTYEPILLSAIKEGDQILGLGGMHETVVEVSLQIQDRYLVKTELGDTICSKDHVFFGKLKGETQEIRASELKKGAILIARDSKFVTVKNVRRIKKGLVYSLKLSGNYPVYVSNGIFHRA